MSEAAKELFRGQVKIAASEHARLDKTRLEAECMCMIALCFKKTTELLGNDPYRAKELFKQLLQKMKLPRQRNRKPNSKSRPKISPEDKRQLVEIHDAASGRGAKKQVLIRFGELYGKTLDGTKTTLKRAKKDILPKPPAESKRHKKKRAVRNN